VGDRLHPESAWQEVARFLTQIGSGPGADPAHAVPRFVIPAIFWAVLAAVALQQYRREHERRDQLMGIAALVGLVREVFQLVVEYGSARGLFSFESVVVFYPPLEHALELGAQIVAGYAFLSAFRGRAPSLRVFLLGGLAVTTLLYLATGVSWAAFVAGAQPLAGSGPRIEFALHWGDMAFRIAGVVALTAVVVGLAAVRGHGAAPRIAALAFSGFLLDHLLMVVNILSVGRNAWILSPVRHNLHMWAVPILLGVYWYELTVTVRQGEARLLRAQKLESLGLLAGGVAHDFNNLLTIVRGNLDFALRALPPGETFDTLTEARNGATRAVELTAQLLSYAGRGAVVVAPVDLSRLAAETALLVRSSLPGGTYLRLACPEELPRVRADATQMRQLIMNLVLNAGQAMGGRSGEIAVRTAEVTCDRAELERSPIGKGLAEGRYVSLEVIDQGAGMSPETTARIFDPFFTTRADGRGLGLAVVMGVVKGHRGALTVESSPGAGTTFRVLLPTG
jgi:signal transduction histidine kinase